MNKSCLHPFIRYVLIHIQAQLAEHKLRLENCKLNPQCSSFSQGREKGKQLLRAAYLGIVVQTAERIYILAGKRSLGNLIEIYGIIATFLNLEPVISRYSSFLSGNKAVFIHFSISP